MQQYALAQSAAPSRSSRRVPSATLRPAAATRATASQTSTPRAAVDTVAHRHHTGERRHSLQAALRVGLWRPAQAALCVTATTCLIGIALPHVGATWLAAAPAYKLGAAALCCATSYALTFAPSAVQRSTTSALVGAALAGALSPGPLALRLLGGAAAGMLGGAGHRWLQTYYPLMLLYGGGIIGLMVLVAAAQVHDCQGA